MTPTARSRRDAIWFWGSAIGWFAAYVLAFAAAESTHWPQGLRILAALLPVPLFASFLAALISGVRQLDELERRIQLEALAVAFPLAMLMLMTLGLLQRVIELSMDDWSYRHVWGFLPLLYVIGLVIARRRYT